MKIKVSAPGKLMLLGEHAVVYGYPCLVTAVDKRLYVQAEIINNKEDEIIAPQVKESRFVLESIAQFKAKFGLEKSVRIITKGDFSHRVGLGSSSAVTVATFKALSLLFKLPLTLREIFDLSYKVNLSIQGVGSGFDLATATYGRTIFFVTGGKIIEPLKINPLPLVVGYSGIKADTPFYIRKVAEAFKRRKEDLNQIFNEITKLVYQAKKAILKSEFKLLGELMTKNHQWLKKLGVSVPKLDKMVMAALEGGAYGAKLSGAGGGDCMIALVDQKNRRKVESAIKKIGGEIIKTKTNAKGVKLEI
ncbi:MAG: mevalonate kinase [Microgenomates group bacterium]|nr:mevalonate kinase [Microgenomates group bacterium]